MPESKIHIFRHSNGEHEKRGFVKSNSRAKLTPQGVVEAIKAGRIHGLSEEQGLIGVWTSPRIRTMQTALLHAYSQIVDSVEDFINSNPDQIAVKAKERLGGNIHLANIPTRDLDYDWQAFEAGMKIARTTHTGLDYLLHKQPTYVEQRKSALRQLLKNVTEKSMVLEGDSQGYICGHSSDLELLLISLALDFGTPNDLIDTWYGFPTGNGFAHNSGFTITHNQSSSTAIVTFGDTQFDFPASKI